MAVLTATGRPPTVKNVTVGHYRSTGPVDRKFLRAELSTRSTDPVDRLESSALWKGPGRPCGRPDRETCSLYPGSVDRPVDRWHNGLKYCNTPFPEYVLSCVFVFFDRIFSIYFLYLFCICLLYTSPSPRDRQKSRMPSSA